MFTANDVKRVVNDINEIALVNKIFASTVLITAPLCAKIRFRNELVFNHRNIDRVRLIFVRLFVERTHINSGRLNVETNAPSWF